MKLVPAVTTTNTKPSQGHVQAPRKEKKKNGIMDKLWKIQQSEKAKRYQQRAKKPC